MTHVIVRISTISIPASRISEYIVHVYRDLIPNFEVAEGLEWVWFLRRRLGTYVEVVTISVWQSEGALTRFFENWPFSEATKEYLGIEFEPRIYTVWASRPGHARRQREARSTEEKPDDVVDQT